MIEGNERIIVVLGMAHSGTTILAYTLQQHPDLVCFTDGAEGWVLENTLIQSERTDTLKSVIDYFPDKRILLKRPWSAVWHGEWLKREIPDAKFVSCWRDFKDIAISWSKHDSMVDSGLRNGDDVHKQSYYDMCKERSAEFARDVSCFRSQYHVDFVNNPKKVMAEITEWAGLAPFEYDVSLVGNGDVKKILFQEEFKRRNL